MGDECFMIDSGHWEESIDHIYKDEIHMKLC